MTKGRTIISKKEKQRIFEEKEAAILNELENKKSLLTAKKLNYEEWFEMEANLKILIDNAYVELLNGYAEYFTKGYEGMTFKEIREYIVRNDSKRSLSNLLKIVEDYSKNVIDLHSYLKRNLKSIRKTNYNLIVFCFPI